jgi:hypothetical protein
MLFKSGWHGRYVGDMLTTTRDGELIRDRLVMTIDRSRVLDLTISDVRVSVVGPTFNGRKIRFTALASKDHEIHYWGTRVGTVIDGTINAPSIEATGTFSVRRVDGR